MDEIKLVGGWGECFGNWKSFVEFDSSLVGFGMDSADSEMKFVGLEIDLADLVDLGMDFMDLPRGTGDLGMNFIDSEKDFVGFIDLLTYGDYPKNKRRLVGDRLPKFTTEQVAMVKSSYDFLGINYYTSYYASDMISPYKVNISYSSDSRVDLTRMAIFPVIKAESLAAIPVLQNYVDSGHPSERLDHSRGLYPWNGIDTLLIMAKIGSQKYRIRAYQLGYYLPQSQLQL
ncbi:hypothetical protein CQW23_14266 [Capsicum baccatum]|uniref:Uncharacterized protein n=1 Tax=Capsicum baccatum TaxID=33114 RepID=A0A2G2WIN9_CAPBA|nr:hypothetical protein CQW23_14266 [Capsicum baccatum]